MASLCGQVGQCYPGKFLISNHDGQNLGFNKASLRHPRANDAYLDRGQRFDFSEGMGKAGIAGADMSSQAQCKLMQCGPVMVVARDPPRIVRNQSEIRAHALQCLWFN